MSANNNQEIENENFEIILDNKTYKKLKGFCEENEKSINEEIGNAFTAYYDDASDEDFEQIKVNVKDKKVYITLSEILYGILEEESENNSTEISEELILLIEEYLSDQDDTYEEEYYEDEEFEDEE